MPRLDPATVRGLIDRVREAKGPSEALDEAVFAAVWGWSHPIHGAARWEFQALHERGRLTGSLDAALGAVRRAIPGTMWAAGNMESGPFCRLVYPIAGRGFGHAVSLEQEGGAGTEPLAVILALLTALLAQAEADDGGQHGG